MKVYELMRILADMPSGAEVHCSGSLSVKELKSYDYCGENCNGESLFSISEEANCISSRNDYVYIEF